MESENPKLVVLTNDRLSLELDRAQEGASRYTLEQLNGEIKRRRLLEQPEQNQVETVNASSGSYRPLTVSGPDQIEEARHPRHTRQVARNTRSRR